MRKRAFDLTIITFAPIGVLPLWLLLWTMIPLMIWLQDRGPIFYRQTRLGKDGRPFTMLKFRTMVVDAERDTGPVWAAPHDPRVTRLGAFLRTTALDELPQVINILRGDMSIVGPRAERPELHALFLDDVPGWEQRLAVRPGLTGLAQVSAGYDAPPQEKLRWDMEYIQRMGLLLDIRIIVTSVGYTLLRRWDRANATVVPPLPAESASRRH